MNKLKITPAMHQTCNGLQNLAITNELHYENFAFISSFPPHFALWFISLDGFEVPNLNSYGTGVDLLFQIEETHLELCQISVMEHLCVRVCSTSVTAWKVSIFAVFLVRIFPHSDLIRENTDQKNSEYGHFSHSV